MKASVYIGISLDGFIARKNGDIDWLTPFADADAVRAYEAYMSGIDVIVIGRATFEKVLSFPTWPYTKPVFLLSNTTKVLPGALRQQVTIVALEPEVLLSRLSAEGFYSAYIDGGQLIQSFLKTDLIDELTIATVPVLLGRGIPLFGELFNDLTFEHVRTEACPNGLVRSYYHRTKAAP